MNVVFVYNRSECTPSDEYCGLWKQCKKKQMKKDIPLENGIVAERNAVTTRYMQYLILKP